MKHTAWSRIFTHRQQEIATRAADGNNRESMSAIGKSNPGMQISTVIFPNAHHA